MLVLYDFKNTPDPESLQLEHNMHKEHPIYISAN